MEQHNIGKIKKTENKSQKLNYYKLNIHIYVFLQLLLTDLFIHFSLKGEYLFFSLMLIHKKLFCYLQYFFEIDIDISFKNHFLHHEIIKGKYFFSSLNLYFKNFLCYDTIYNIPFLFSHSGSWTFILDFNVIFSD